MRKIGFVLAISDHQMHNGIASQLLALVNKILFNVTLHESDSQVTVNFCQILAVYVKHHKLVRGFLALEYVSVGDFTLSLSMECGILIETSISLTSYQSVKLVLQMLVMLTIFSVERV